VLTLTFELRVPPGLKANIRGTRVAAAINGLRAAVVATAPIVFPWADRVDMQATWAYVWEERGRETTTLAPTADNTI